MNVQDQEEEIRCFKLMDNDNTGFITWTEYLDFEVANLLTKKNKVISNGKVILLFYH